MGRGLGSLKGGQGAPSFREKVWPKSATSVVARVNLDDLDPIPVAIVYLIYGLVRHLCSTDHVRIALRGGDERRKCQVGQV